MVRPKFLELKAALLGGNPYTQTQCIGHACGHRCTNALPLHLIKIARERLKVDVQGISEVDVRDILSCLLCERQTCGQNIYEKQAYHRLWSGELRHLDLNLHDEVARYPSETKRTAHEILSSIERKEMARKMFRSPQSPHHKSAVAYSQQSTHKHGYERNDDKDGAVENAMTGRPSLSTSMSRYSTPSLSETVSTGIDDNSDVEDDAHRKHAEATTPYQIRDKEVDIKIPTPEPLSPFIWSVRRTSPEPLRKLRTSKSSPSDFRRIDCTASQSPSSPLTYSATTPKSTTSTPSSKYRSSKQIPPTPISPLAQKDRLPRLISKSPPIANVHRSPRQLVDSPTQLQVSSPQSDADPFTSRIRPGHVSLPAPPPAVYPRPMQRYKHFTAPARASPVMDLDTRVSPVTNHSPPGAPTSVPILFTVPKSPGRNTAARTSRDGLTRAATSPITHRPYQSWSGRQRYTSQELVRTRLEEMAAADKRVAEGDFPRIGQVWPMVSAMMKGYTGLIGDSLRCFGR